MAVKMRLRRMGAKGQPSYRIVIADSRSPRDGRYIDQVGFYNPLTNPATITVNREKAIDWLQKGAEPTETVAILLRKFDIPTRQAPAHGAPVGAAVAPATEETVTVTAEEAPVPEEESGE